MTDSGTKDELGESPWNLRDATAHGQFELMRDGKVLGWIRYRSLARNRYILLHTEVVQSHRGQGTGQAIVEAVLREIHSRQGKVTAICPFVAEYLLRNERYRDLIDVTLPDHVYDPEGLDDR